MSNIITTVQEGFEKKPFPAFIDSTTRGSFVSCPRLYFLSFMQGYSPHAKNVNLTAGGAIAKGLEVARKAKYLEGKSNAEAEMLGITALMGEYAAMAGDFMETFSTDAKSLDRCIEAFQSYFIHFGWDADHIQPLVLDSKPAVEFSFSLPLDVMHPETGDPLVYTGRYDMIGTYTDNLFVVDEKTTKQLGPTWSNNWILRSQITGYTWAARQFGYPVLGAIIRGICFTKEIKFAESIQYRDDWEVDRWYAQLNRDAQRMVECWKQDYWDFSLDTACANYGGCQFVDICKAKSPKRWLDSDYITREWNPLHKD